MHMTQPRERLQPKDAFFVIAFKKQQGLSERLRKIEKRMTMPEELAKGAEGYSFDPSVYGCTRTLKRHMDAMASRLTGYESKESRLWDQSLGKDFFN
jgi:hypothetical protein